TAGDGNVSITGAAGVGAGSFAIIVGDPSGNKVATTGAGNITLTGDSLNVDTTNGVIDAGTHIVTLQTKTAGRAIDLGSNTAGTLALTEGELARVKAGTLRIGRNDASASGTITLSAPVDLTTASTVGGFTVPTLQLFTGSNVVDGTAGEQTDLNVATLSITAGG